MRQRRPLKLPALSEADIAAGVRVEMRSDGAALVFPPPVVAALHRNTPGNFCPKCHQRFSEGCDCPITATELDSKPHYARPWGWKGPMVLPVEHEDHPLHKSKRSSA